MSPHANSSSHSKEFPWLLRFSDKGEIANAELVSFGVSSETVGRVGWGNSIWLKIIINKTKLVLK